MPTTIRLSANQGLPSRRYVHPPVSVTADTWTDHEITKELIEVLTTLAAGRIIVHGDDAGRLAEFGYQLVDNEVVPVQAKLEESQPSAAAAQPQPGKPAKK